MCRVLCAHSRHIGLTIYVTFAALTMTRAPRRTVYTILTLRVQHVFFQHALAKNCSVFPHMLENKNIFLSSELEIIFFRGGAQSPTGDNQNLKIRRKMFCEAISGVYIYHSKWHFHHKG